MFRYSYKTSNSFIVFIIYFFFKSHIFNMVTPAEVYDNLLNIAKFTKKKCSQTDIVGNDFNLYDGMIIGKNLKLLKNRYYIFLNYVINDLILELLFKNGVFQIGQIIISQ